MPGERPAVGAGDRSYHRVGIRPLPAVKVERRNAGRGRPVCRQFDSAPNRPFCGTGSGESWASRAARIRQGDLISLPEQWKRRHTSAHRVERTVRKYARLCIKRAHGYRSLIGRFGRRPRPGYALSDTQATQSDTQHDSRWPPWRPGWTTWNH